MALDFTDSKGKASKSKPDAYTYTDGEQSVRLFGGIVPRYVYWLEGTNNKSIPVECLAFNREKEKFDNVEVDHVPKYFPNKKCQWAYSINAIDLKDGKAKVLNLKKKLLEQIMVTAESLGDPTDPETGWDVTFKRTKTGPAAFNVEYTLAPLKCKKRPLTAEEKATVEADPGIDTKVPRPTEDEVKGLLDRITTGGGASDDTPEEVSSMTREKADDI